MKAILTLIVTVMAGAALCAGGGSVAFAQMATETPDMPPPIAHTPEEAAPPAAAESPETAEDLAEGHSDEAADAHHGAGGGEHSSGGLPQLDPTWYASQIFWMIVIFAALYGIYGYSVLPALGGIIQTRRDRIQNDLDQAQLMKNEAEKLRRTYESSLHESHMKAGKLVSDAEDSMKELASQRYQTFRAKSAKIMEDAESAIQSARKEAMEDMTVIAAEIASSAAQKIVGVTTDIDQAKSVVKNIHRKAA